MRNLSSQMEGNKEKRKTKRVLSAVSSSYDSSSDSDMEGYASSSDGKSTTEKKVPFEMKILRKSYKASERKNKWLKNQLLQKNIKILQLQEELEKKTNQLQSCLGSFC